MLSGNAQGKEIRQIVSWCYKEAGGISGSLDNSQATDSLSRGVQVRATDVVKKAVM
jgi:hypothetical protein